MEGQVVEIKKQFTEYKKDKDKEISELKESHKAEIKEINRRHGIDNEIQAGLANILSSLSKFGVSVNGKLSEILTRDIYNTVCTDIDGVSEINKYAGTDPAKIINR